MVDMGQADSSLYHTPSAPKRAWSVYLRMAAKDMGYESYADVPEERVTELKALAYSKREISL